MSKLFAIIISLVCSPCKKIHGSGWCTRDPARVMYDLDWPNRSRRRVGDKRAPIYIGNPAAKLRGERSRFIGAICIIVKVFGIGSGRPLRAQLVSPRQTRSIFATSESNFNLTLSIPSRLLIISLASVLFLLRINSFNARPTKLKRSK